MGILLSLDSKWIDEVKGFERFAPSCCLNSLFSPVAQSAEKQGRQERSPRRISRRSDVSSASFEPDLHL